MGTRKCTLPTVHLICTWLKVTIDPRCNRYGNGKFYSLRDVITHISRLKVDNFGVYLMHYTV